MPPHRGHHDLVLPEPGKDRLTVTGIVSGAANSGTEMASASGTSSANLVRIIGASLWPSASQLGAAESTGITARLAP